jgi:hypothetical protein
MPNQIPARDPIGGVHTPPISPRVENPIARKRPSSVPTTYPRTPRGPTRDVRDARPGAGPQSGVRQETISRPPLNFR